MKEGLKGKRAAISRFGSASNFVTRMALEQLGLLPDKDVAIVQVGAVPTHIDRSGFVDSLYRNKIKTYS